MRLQETSGGPRSPSGTLWNHSAAPLQDIRGSRSSSSISCLLFHSGSPCQLVALRYTCRVCISELLSWPSCLILPSGILWPSLNSSERDFPLRTMSSFHLFRSPRSGVPTLVIAILLRFSQNNNKRVVKKLMVKIYSFKKVQRNKGEKVLFFSMFMIICNVLMGVKEWLKFYITPLLKVINHIWFEIILYYFNIK